MAKKLRFKKACRLGHLKKDGSENLCSKPTELRANFTAPKTLRQKIRDGWKEFREQELENSSEETLEDAQDFNISNEIAPSSPYEVEGEMGDLLDQQEAAALEAQSKADEAAAKSQKIKEKENAEENTSKSSEKEDA
jgi:hypothetical protein